MKGFRSLLGIGVSAVTLLIGLAACSGDQAPTAKAEGEQTTAAPPLRVLTLRQPGGEDHLPRDGMPESAELELVDAFAQSEGRSVQWEFIDDLNQILPALRQGRGDIAAANLTVTPERRKQVSFSTPVAFVREVVVARSDDPVKDRLGLGGRKVAVKVSSAFHETLRQTLAIPYQPAFTITPVPEGLSDDALLDAVAAGNYDLTVLDSNSAEALLAGRDDLRKAFDLSKVRPIAWALRPNDHALLERVNNFLGEHRLLPNLDERSTADLPTIKKRGVLRVATRNNAATYFLWRGELLGFEYELAKRFAERQGLRLEMVVPPQRSDLLAWVKDGRADIAAASLTITPTREGNGIAFSRPYNHVSELLVCRTADKSLTGPRDLSGRTVVVRRSSSYWETLQTLRRKGVEFTVEAAPEELETENIMDKVAAGGYDLTAADSNLLDIELTWRDDLRSAFALTDPLPHGWALRSDNPKLLAAVNAFLKKEYRGLFYNITYKKYFENPKQVRAHAEQRSDAGKDGKLSPYDDLARKYAKRYGMDWRLLVAQMYQESRFDPNAKSWAGALGLLQVLPRTAREFGISDLHDPDSGLHAGVAYLQWLMKRFEPQLDVANRTWFALAAYNAGVGHVRDARRLAKQKGWDQNRWFDNVEKAMLLLSEQKFARKARHGYVRGEEPVAYVQQIRDRFRAYTELLGE